MHVWYLSVAHDVRGEWDVSVETVWGARVLCVIFIVRECVWYVNTDVLIILCAVLCGLCGSVIVCHICSMCGNICDDCDM